MSGFSPVQLSLPHPCTLPSLEVTKLGSYALHKLFGILLHRRHVSSPLLIYSIICICIDSWIFYFILCFIIQSYIIYFVAQIICVFYTDLFSATTTQARLIPPLESAISPRSYGFFSQRMVLETKIWYWMCSFLLGCPCFCTLSHIVSTQFPS